LGLTFVSQHCPGRATSLIRRLGLHLFTHFSSPFPFAALTIGLVHFGLAIFVKCRLALIHSSFDSQTLLDGSP
jgi:hypothetical protein